MYDLIVTHLACTYINVQVYANVDDAMNGELASQELTCTRHHGKVMEEPTFGKALLAASQGDDLSLRLEVSDSILCTVAAFPVECVGLRTRYSTSVEANMRVFVALFPRKGGHGLDSRCWQRLLTFQQEVTLDLYIASRPAM